MLSKSAFALLAILFLFTMDIQAQTINPLDIKPFIFPELYAPLFPARAFPIRYNFLTQENPLELRVHTFPPIRLSNESFFDMKTSRIITVIEVMRSDDLRIYMTVPAIKGKARLIQIIDLDGKKDKE